MFLLKHIFQAKVQHDMEKSPFLIGLSFVSFLVDFPGCVFAGNPVYTFPAPLYVC